MYHQFPTHPHTITNLASPCPHKPFTLYLMNIHKNVQIAEILQKLGGPAYFTEIFPFSPHDQDEICIPSFTTPPDHDFLTASPDWHVSHVWTAEDCAPNDNCGHFHAGLLTQFILQGMLPVMDAGFVALVINNVGGTASMGAWSRIQSNRV